MSLIVYLVAAKKWLIKIVSFGLTLVVLFLSFKYSLARNCHLRGGGNCMWIFLHIYVANKKIFSIFNDIIDM